MTQLLLCFAGFIVFTKRCDLIGPALSITTAIGCYGGGYLPACLCSWSRDGRVGHFFPGPGTSRAFFPYSFLNELWLDHNFVSSNRAELEPGQNKGRAKTRPGQNKGLQILSSNFYHFNCYICLAVPHTLWRYLSLLHNTCKLLLNGAFILELMMKSIWFWSMKILKVLCEYRAYFLNN